MKVGQVEIPIWDVHSNNCSIRSQSCTIPYLSNMSPMSLLSRVPLFPYPVCTTPRIPTRCAGVNAMSNSVLNKDKRKPQSIAKSI